MYASGRGRRGGGKRRSVDVWSSSSSDGMMDSSDGGSEVEFLSGSDDERAVSGRRKRLKSGRSRGLKRAKVSGVRTPSPVRDLLADVADESDDVDEGGSEVGVLDEGVEAREGGKKLFSADVYCTKCRCVVPAIMVGGNEVYRLREDVERSIQYIRSGGVER